MPEIIGTLVVLLIVVAAVAAIVRKLIRNKKRGVSSCGCNCSSCPMGGSCKEHK